MKDTPLVTIAIPVYNCEKTIQQTLRSVLNQTLADYEVLIYDDGSTDRTIPLIQAFQDPRIKLFQDGGNRGIACRLNQLIEQASGQFLVRMDGDDVMFPDRLEKQVAFLQSHPDVDVVGSAAVVIDEHDHVLGLRGGESRAWTIDDLFMSSRFIHPTVAGKTTWFKRWKYDEQLSGCEDMDLWIRSCGDSVFADMAEPLLFYREYQNMRLSTYLRRQRLLMAYAWGRRDQLERKKKLLPLLLKPLLSSLAAIVAHLCRCDRILILRRNRPITPAAYERASAVLKAIK